MWWESSPMRYDWRRKITAEPGSLEYFREIDDRFFETVRHFMPWQKRPFDSLIDFDSLRRRRVLEIGVGHGSHAQLIAPHSKSFTGIDLTEIACQMTRRRFELLGLKTDIFKMDAENMSFPDESFDYIWSWGVVHHSANTMNVLREMYRVLSPGGEAVLMVYHRSFWKYYVETGFVRGILGGDLFRYRSLNKVLQSASDGAIARYYKPKEWLEMCQGLFEVNNFLVFGQKTDLLLLPYSFLKNMVMRILPDSITRFFTNRLRFGSLLVVKMRKGGSQQLKKLY